MNEHRGCPVVDFDHNDPHHSADPVASYRALRERTPIAWTEAQGGYWVLSDYAGVFDAAREHEVFSSARSSRGGEGLNNVIPKSPTRLHIPVELDPPEHRWFRKLLNELTAPAAVVGMQPMIDRWTTWFVDDVIEKGSCDLASVIGVPAVVTLDWLGLDVGDWRRFTRALHAPLAEVRGSEAYARAVEVEVPWMQARITNAIRDRRTTPAHDVISHLLAQSVDGRPITDEEVYSLVELLISGGVGTTASLVSQTLVHLSQHPDQRHRLIDEPELIERAVEEFLRAFSPTQALARTVVSDVDFHGCPMREGDRVLLAWSSANRDPAQFDDADEVVLDRWPNRHTAFGMGVHRCAGAHLARAMARTMIGQIVERMPDYVVDVDAARTYPHQGVNAGYVSIPATFTPGPRRGGEADPA